MNKHFLYNIMLATSLVGISACSNDVANNSYTVGEADNEIRFATGVVSGNMTRAITRANYNTESYQFLPLSAGTKVHIKTEGTWEGKSTITHYTQTGTAKALDASKSEIENVGIYWDDYGIGDPANSANRSAGINVYAACVDGKPASAIGTISNWEGLSWTLPADMSTWKDKDLLFSNNNSDEGATNSTGMNKANVGRYKFDTQKEGTACNLELHHAMSKITVNLKAGEGFPIVDGVAKFENDPTVTLSSFNLGGTVNIKTLTATATGNSGTATLAKATTATTNFTATYEGLIFPGNALEASHKAAAKSGGLAKINCDGNIFTIYADEIMTAMNKAEETATDANDGDTEFHSGKNYILNIIVNKTAIKVTATVVDWVNVTAADETPLINVTTSYGQEGTNFGKGFSFLRSTSINDGYTNDATIGYADNKYTMSPQLYWPNHSTHYFFRGVWPLVGALTSLETAETPNTQNTLSSNVTGNAITVKNVPYEEGKYPSDLMLGYPRITTESCPHGNPVAASGICATEGEIRMNFQYVMSQVEVNLHTNDAEGATNKVNFDSNTKVEIVDAYTDGTILLSDGSATMGTNADYTMNRKGASNVAYHDAVIPQGVTTLKFRITVKDPESSTLDSYETVFTISEIEVIEGTNPAAKITDWEPGKHYVYNLLITKTGIKVTATIKDWVTATGGTTIWM